MKAPWLLVVVGALVPALPGLADSPPDCPRPRAELGVRYRFTAGDFLTAEDGTRWVRFLTEPRVTSVAPGGPADGRLEADDAIVSVDGHLVTTEAGSRSFQFASDGTKTLVVRRRGELREVRLRPLARCREDEPARESSTDTPPDGATAPKLGIRFRCIDCGLDRVDGRERWRFGSAPEVTAVVPGSAAEAAGLGAGDLLVAIDGMDSTSPEGGRRFAELRPGEKVRLAFERDGVRQEVTLVVGAGR